jgi:hypothetical protein
MVRKKSSIRLMRKCFSRALFISRVYSLLVNDDIEGIIPCGEERTAQLNSKYEGLNLEDLSNFKSDTSVQQWEGEDFRTGVRRVHLVLPCY